MLICKNCDSENSDGAQKCHNCQMEDHFIYVSQDQPEIIKVDHHPQRCTNCGCESRGEGDKCVECHFPIAQGRKLNGRSLFQHHQS